MVKPPEHRKSVTHPGRGAGDMRIPASLPGRVRFLFGSPVVSPPANGRGASGTDGFHLVCRLSHRLLIPIPHCEWITGGGASQSSLDFSPNSRRLWAKAQASLRSLRFARRTLGGNACRSILNGDLVSVGSGAIGTHHAWNALFPFAARIDLGIKIRSRSRSAATRGTPFQFAVTKLNRHFHLLSKLAHSTTP